MVCRLQPLALLPAAFPDVHGSQLHGGPCVLGAPCLVVYQGHIHPMVTENVTNSGSNGELFGFFLFLK